MRCRCWLLVLAGCLAGGASADSPPPEAVVAETAREAAPAVLLAVPYRGEDPRPFLASEKFDGVRAVWDGKQLRFRSGRLVAAPDWFTAVLPREPLDGELWLGRGRFDELSGIVRMSPPSDKLWRNVRYVVFELPGEPGSFERRAERIRAIVQAVGVPWLAYAEQRRVSDRAALRILLDEIVRAGGEGLMLHRADSVYAAGRTGDLLKMKPLQDAEAMVVGYEPGRGRLSGVVGALRLRMPEGREFRLGSGLSDSVRRNPPAIGSLVTYRFQSLTPEGLPRFARYWRMYQAF